MSTKTISIESGKQYLSEVIEFLPSHCLINKGITGCGGTTLELICKRNSVILVPTKNLVISKCLNSKNYFGVVGDITKQQIREYANCQIEFKKIIGTYDSLGKIMDAIPECTNWFLLIDEYHLLFNDYSFRSSAILGILNNFRRFINWCFLTATPLNDKCILKELEDIDRIKFKWEDATKVNITIRNTPYIQREIINVINSYPTRNIHIFLNSVGTIKYIVNKLSISDFRVICSTNQTTRVKNKREITSPICKLNFYTSCSFEGVDINDENGMCVILCDTKIASTVLDISTKIRQICGRIRNSKYKDECIVILNTKTHRYLGCSKQTFLDKVNLNEKRGLSRMEVINHETDEQLTTDLLWFKATPMNYMSIYINQYDTRFFFDENLKKIDIYNYELISEIYNSTISVLTEYKKQDFNACEYSRSEIFKSDKKGLEWINKIIYESNKATWTYSEIEDVFPSLFKEHYLEWHKKSSIKTFFPEYVKKREIINGKRQITYFFPLVCKTSQNKEQFL